MHWKDWRTKFFRQGAFAKSSAILFLGTMLAGLLNYVFHLVIGRAVSVEIYGEAESLISLITIISVLAMTLAMVATKYVASCKAEDDKKGTRELLRYLNSNVLKYSLPIFLLIALATPFIGNFLKIQNDFALLLIWIAMFLSFFSAVNTGVLAGWQKFKHISLAGVWGAAIKLISGVVLVKVGFALSGIVGSFVLGTIAAYIATVLALRFITLEKEDPGAAPHESTVDLASIKSYILPAFVGNLAITILGNADMVLAKHNLDALSAGQYGALTVVSKIIFFVTGIIASVLFSLSAENSHKGDSSGHILKTALILAFGTSLGVTLVYFLYPTFVLSLFFGNKYQNVAPYLGWFAVAVTLFSVSNVIFQYLLSLNKTRISYALLTISLGMVLSIVIFGRGIGVIISEVIAAQVISIACGTFFILKEKYPKKHHAIDFYRHPGF